VSENQWLDAWFEAGRRNPWIRTAYDPPFTKKSLYACLDPLDLYDRIMHGNWCLGQGFWWADQCWIEQTNGGGEWLVIKQDVTFESVTAEWMEAKRPGALFDTIMDIHASTREQCAQLLYKDNRLGVVTNSPLYKDSAYRLIAQKVQAGELRLGLSDV
jgi:hypothetical protein